MSPAFEEAYTAAWDIAPVLAPTLEMLTMRPQPRSFIPAPNARDRRNGARRLTAIVRSKSAIVVSSIGFSTRIAALFTRMSAAPTSARIASIAAGSDRSARIVRTMGPVSWSRTSTPMTTWPSAASASAMARPMPCALPVTSAVRTVNVGAPACTAYMGRAGLSAGPVPDRRDDPSAGGCLGVVLVDVPGVDDLMVDEQVLRHRVALDRIDDRR